MEGMRVAADENGKLSLTCSPRVWERKIQRLDVVKEMMSELSLEDEGGVRFIAGEGEAGVKEKRDRAEKCSNAR